MLKPLHHLPRLPYQFVYLDNTLLNMTTLGFCPSFSTPLPYGMQLRSFPSRGTHDQYRSIDRSPLVYTRLFAVEVRDLWESHPYSPSPSKSRRAIPLYSHPALPTNNLRSSRLLLYMQLVSDTRQQAWQAAAFIASMPWLSSSRQTGSPEHQLMSASVLLRVC